MANDRARISKSLQSFVGNPDNYSARVNGIISRYRAIVTSATPALSKGEWLAICDANNSTWLKDVNLPPEEPARGLRMNIADFGPDGIAEKWGVDLLELAQKLRDMTIAEQTGVFEVVVQFWERSDEKHENYRSMLEACGAKITE